MNAAHASKPDLTIAKVGPIRNPRLQMNQPIGAAFREELHRFRTAADSQVETAWTALSRAHILSQSYALRHVQVHWMMLCYAWRTREIRELTGQIPRLILAAPASWLGRAPLGNTGRSDVGMFRPMSIAADLREILNPGYDAGAGDPGRMGTER